MSTSTSTPMSSSASACRFFQSPQGCFRGASCTFRHDGEPSAASAAVDDVPLSAANPYANGCIPSAAPRACRFFQSEGGCRNGSSCPFVHDAGASGPEAAEFSPYDELRAPPLPQDFPVAVASGGAVFYNHPGLPPPMMLAPPTDVEAAGDEIPTATAPNGRRKLQIQANPQKKEVICEILPVLTRDIEGPFFAIDVECVATGNGTNDRDVARIAVVDEDEKVVFDQYVKPTKPIVSYLTQLTGITESNLEGAPDLEEALVRLKAILPVESVIVGQSIKKDLEWLTLQKPTDYKGEFDVADLFRLPMQLTNGVVRYRYFSLRHVAKYLLGQDIQEADHDPVIDAREARRRQSGTPIELQPNMRSKLPTGEVTTCTISSSSSSMVSSRCICENSMDWAVHRTSPSMVVKLNSQLRGAGIVVRVNQVVGGGGVNNGNQP
ncbi:RNA exonuclease 4 [Phytophthora cinnamomi]|uniref:RNA exonuclease 4 n=1 Tax=Phytophthora cinnamomi TaxID=4785 RepID=UPI00355A6A2C|nr:RNA exonuclease 4 [Phytophthora cinnamomi]